MKNNKGKVYIVIPIIVVLAILVAYFYGWNIGAYFNKDRTAYNVMELATLINEDIDNGKESGTFYVTDITESDIVAINDYVCSINGVVKEYSVKEKSRNGMKVLIKYTISDNYYVIRKYIDGVDLPSDRPEAVKLYNKVSEILEDIIKPGMTDYEKELAIHDYIVLNCEYGYTDYAKEYAFRAYGVLIHGKGVCNGYAEAMSMLLSCAGVENYIMIGEAYSEGEYDLHAWNAVLLDGKWYQVDATWDDPVPDQKGFAAHSYFNVSDDIMDDTHVWDNDNYETCSSLDYNYFEYNNLIISMDGLKSVVEQAAARDITGTIQVLITDYSDDYDWNTIFEIPGVNYFEYTKTECGNDTIITIFLNRHY